MKAEYLGDLFRIKGKKLNAAEFLMMFTKNRSVRFLYFYRKKNIIAKIIERKMRLKYDLEIYSKNIGAGLFLPHPQNITIAKNAVIGENCNISNGVVIGCQARGVRKGVPKIGKRVWIGANAVIVGKITVGDNVLIAPNSFVNRDIPSNSIIIGNPLIIKEDKHATVDYINNEISIGVLQ